MIRLAFALAALAAASGCGVRGSLERPDPMWNADEVIARECARAEARGEPLDPRCAEPPDPQ